MAIRSGGPRPPAAPPATPEASREQPTSDVKKGEPQKDAQKDGYQSGSFRMPPQPPTKRSGRAQGAVIHGAIASLTEQIGGLEKEAARLKELIAAGAFSHDALARISKKLDRIRAQLDAARKKLNKYRRELNEAHGGFDELEEIDLDKVESAIERLERYSSGWAKALGAMEVLAEMGADPKRRISLKGAERRAALDYAESANPTTAIADLASSALDLVSGEPGSSPRPATELGRHLRSMQKLEHLVSPSDDPAAKK
ncbi:MAG: hypothetical protein HY791_07885 [Deltaproteobacteria bacterium]|nr:hypothetical protein [Deltaproteobacteria bacterium]